MKFLFRPTFPVFGLLLGTTAVLSGCGGSTSSSSQPVVGIASGVTTYTVVPPAAASQTTVQIARPSFHVAPVILEAPDGLDAIDNAASAQRAPAVHTVPAEFQGMSTKRLNLEVLREQRRQYGNSSTGNAAPNAKSSAVITYTPAQIRSAYGLPTLPASGATISASQAAALGAGQTIYIVDANSDPNAAAELVAFNQYFGLPTCTTTAISTSASLPLAAASNTGCQFSVVYSNSAGTMTSTAPAYDSGWATEIALDVQWTHATAPLARIILIEAPDASTNSLLAAVNLANKMGPGSVSMSFGAAEGSWTASYDATFTAANMTYLAATGDSGTGVEWPAVSSHVLAVGGTTLSYSGTGARTESAWSGSGGGISAYVATPSFQTSSVPGLGSPGHRALPDVAFNADPSSGQYLAVMSPGSSSVSWLSAGGTSLATPQWAALIAIANAKRALVAKAALGAVHSSLYGQISTSATTYASAFLDVTQGADGSCPTCSAHAGFDETTGLGTPNVGSMLTQLGGSSGNPPVVTPAGISGVAGVPLTFTVSVSAPDAVTYSLSGQPSGLTINNSGAVSWTAPVTGTYPVTVTATDSVTGLKGSGVYTVTISKATAPVVNSQGISGMAGQVLSFTPVISAQDAVTLSLTSHPSGMTVSASGVVSWAAPVKGTYAVTVTAKDSKTGLSGSGVYTVTIAAAPPPSVTGANITGTVGTALSFNVAVSAVNPVTYSLSGAPSGMAISSAGVVSWPKPVAGSYSVTVVAKDSVTGLTGSGIFAVKISSAGPSIVAPAMTGKVGTKLTGTITISDPTATSLNISISGVPMGMTFAVNGLTITATWNAPVAGSYSLKVSAVDSAGLSSQLAVPVTVAAH